MDYLSSYFLSWLVAFLSHLIKNNLLLLKNFLQQNICSTIPQRVEEGQHKRNPKWKSFSKKSLNIKEI